MQVILIRHGKTRDNAELRYSGRTDEPLSAEGIELTRRAGSDPTVGTVYVTALQRTAQTAAMLFPQAGQVVVDDLREMDFGDFEGRCYAEMEQDQAYRAWVEGGCLSPCPNGEGRAEFCRRVCAAFEAVIRDAALRGEQTLYFVVHGGTIMAIMERFARPQKDYYSYSVKNTRGYRCRVETRGELILSEVAAWEGMN